MVIIPATFSFKEDNGAGPTITTPTNSNWKNIDDSTTAYTANPITAGNNSFEKWIYGQFSGTFNTLLNGKWAHTATAFGTGLTLKGQPTMTADANRLAYATPSTTANASLTVDMTAVTAIGSGQTVWFGATGPATSGKAASVDGSVTRFTNYLTTQLQTTSSAAAGDTAKQKHLTVYKREEFGGLLRAA